MDFLFSAITDTIMKLLLPFNDNIVLVKHSMVLDMLIGKTRGEDKVADVEDQAEPVEPINHFKCVRGKVFDVSSDVGILHCTVQDKVEKDVYFDVLSVSGSVRCNDLVYCDIKRKGPHVAWIATAIVKMDENWEHEELENDVHLENGNQVSKMAEQNTSSESSIWPDKSDALVPLPSLNSSKSFTFANVDEQKSLQAENSLVNTESSLKSSISKGSDEATSEYEFSQAAEILCNDSRQPFKEITQQPDHAPANLIGPTVFRDNSLSPVETSSICNSFDALKARKERANSDKKDFASSPGEAASIVAGSKNDFNSVISVACQHHTSYRGVVDSISRAGVSLVMPAKYFRLGQRIETERISTGTSVSSCFLGWGLCNGVDLSY